MALVRGDTLQIWQLEPINGVRYPRNIETLWSDVELATVGLYRIIRFVLSPGKRKVSGPTYSIVDGKAVESYVVEDIPPPTAEEIEAAKEEQTPRETEFLFKVLFNHENRIRALESRPALTTLQFRTALKALIS